MKSKKYILKYFTTLALGASLFGGCKKDFFELKDQNGINSDIWNDEGAVTLFLDKGYDLIMPQWPSTSSSNIHNSSDELNSVNTTFLYGQLTDNSITDIASGNAMGTNRYWDIRRCNLAIDGINQSTLTDAVKTKLKGQFFFLRAYSYFNLVRLYGGVPLVLHAQEISEDGFSLGVARAKTSTCIAQIVSDLDSAAAFLPSSWASSNKGRIIKAAALAYKGKVLMYWASPQFNPTNISSRWDEAYTACKAAYDTCVANGIALYGTYGNIFTVEDNSEVLIYRKHDAISVSPGRGTNNEYVTRPRSETTGAAGGGQNQPTVNLVNAYLMKDGMPTSQSTTTYPYNSTLFWQNRDPRFDATIAYNGGSFALSGNSGRKQWSYNSVLDEGGGLTATGFYCKKLCNPNLPAVQTQYNSNTGGGSGMDWIEMRFAEVIANLAECANETGRLTEAKDMIRMLRVRAGIVIGAKDYGLGIATDMASMRELIVNERMIEFAMEGKRYHDLRRLRRFHLLTGTVRQKMTWVAKVPYVAGQPPRPADPTKIYLDSLYPASGFKPRDTANLNNPIVYAAMFTTAISSLDSTTPINFPTTYYFYPLPNFFKNSSYMIEQTIGWPGGSFDPLQ